MKQVFIYDAIRSPRAKAKSDGGLHDLLPQELLQSLYQSLEKRTGLFSVLGDTSQNHFTHPRWIQAGTFLQALVKTLQKVLW